MDERATLCRVTPALEHHLMVLLGDAGVSAAAAPDGDLVRVTVPESDAERARAVVGLVLPGLLEPEADTVRLSDRLVRSDSQHHHEPEHEPEHDAGPELLDGRAAFMGAPAAEQPPTATDYDDFVPPPPPAIPQPRDRISRFAWGAVILGPLLLLLTVMFTLPSIITAAGLGMSMAGFVTLVARKDDTPREGWDDGAVI